MGSWTNITEMKKYTYPELPGIEEHMWLEEMRNTLIEWCEQTRAFTCELDPIMIVANQDTYDLDAPSAGNIIAAGLVELNGNELTPSADYVMPSPCQIKLQSVPSAATNIDAGETGLEVEVQLMPTLTTTIIPKQLFDYHHETWKFGVLGKLMQQENMRWSRSTKGQDYEARFWERIGLERVKQNQGSINSELQVGVTHPFVISQQQTIRNPFTF